MEFHMPEVGSSGKDCLEGNFILYGGSLFIKYLKSNIFFPKYTGIKSQTFWLPIV